MSLLNILSIAGSAMTAQSRKINTIASNLANIDSIVYEKGKFHPYIGKEVIFELDPLEDNNEVGGVKISDIVNNSNPMKSVYNPHNPMADDKGYVLSSNVDPIEEIVNNISAARSYQANIEVLKTAKSMIIKTLTIGE